MDQSQLEQARRAVERKKETSKAASEQTGRRTPGDSKVRGDQPERTEAGRPQDELSPRVKSSGKGKKTADKWNQ